MDLLTAFATPYEFLRKDAAGNRNAGQLVFRTMMRPNETLHVPDLKLLIPGSRLKSEN